MSWIDTERDWNWMLDNWNRVLVSANIKAGDCCSLHFLLVHFLDFGLPMKLPREWGACVFQAEAKVRNNGLMEY